jgi:ubiquinone/menaquinone biosynthesis C-methylase UbiE
LIAPSAGTYEGIDLSPVAIQVARRLRLPNARFQVGDGSSLPFPDNSFDVVLCWDVVASFPEFEDAAELVTDMFRVVAPGGCALVGIVPDRDADLDEFMRRAAALTAELDRRYGPLPERRRPPYPIRLLQRLRAARRQDPEVQPWVGVYYFRRDEFRELGKRLAAETTITEMHPLHPYVGFRFNACYRKPK